jgi:hypothetical protein
MATLAIVRRMTAGSVLFIVGGCAHPEPAPAVARHMAPEDIAIYRIRPEVPFRTISMLTRRIEITEPPTAASAWEREYDEKYGAAMEWFRRRASELGGDAIVLVDVGTEPLAPMKPVADSAAGFAWTYRYNVIRFSVGQRSLGGLRDDR